MSTVAQRSLSGPVQIIEFPSPQSFADRYVAAGFFLPDQATMKLMMRATAAGLPWSAPEKIVESTEHNTPRCARVEFIIFSAREYADIPFCTFGAPMPLSIADHINKVKDEFPEATVQLHAHPFEDPFVEFTLDGESILTAAWRRTPGKCEIYPRG